MDFCLANADESVAEATHIKKSYKHDYKHIAKIILQKSSYKHDYTPQKTINSTEKWWIGPLSDWKKCHANFLGVEQPVLAWGKRATSVCLVYFQVLRWYQWHHHIPRTPRSPLFPKQLHFQVPRALQEAADLSTRLRLWWGTYMIEIIHIDILHLFTDRFIQYNRFIHTV